MEDIEPTPALLEALGKAKEKGFQIALDDFVMKESHRSLLELGDFVKVDVLAVPFDEIQNQLKYFEPYPIKILAEKVEDRWVFERCLKLGFKFFQGYFFCKPQIVEGMSLSSNRMAIVMLLAKLQDPNLQVQDLSELVKNDVALSLKLLRYVTLLLWDCLEL